MNNQRTLSIVVLAALLLAGCSREREEYFNGRSLATADVAKGVLRLASAPDAVQPSPWYGDYNRLLETNYGIKPCFFYLPNNPRAAEAWVRGYNEVSQLEIERRFGTNLLKRTANEAQALYETKTQKSGR